MYEIYTMCLVFQKIILTLIWFVENASKRLKTSGEILETPFWWVIILRVCNSLHGY
jgi:hypothetical protein